VFYVYLVMMIFVFCSRASTRTSIPSVIAAA